MSYQVLARKWRPQNFDDLVGQEHVSRTLANAITCGRIHHAFLFTGARGVGKTSAARILAKALNCEAGLTPTPCNVCPSCVEITAGQGLDVFEIDGASNTGVDDIRELRENIRYLPSRSRYKLFIIDEVHMLSLNAFNALLKTLEEPPSHAKFIFATTEPHKIPITILSRCQRFDFRKIALAPVIACLRKIVDVEQITISDRALTLVARRGEGSMRDSLSTLDQVIAFCGETVIDDDVQGLLGLIDRRLLHDTIEGLVRRDSRLVLETLRRVDDQGYAFRQFCQELVEALRALVLLKVTSEPGELLDVTLDELQQLQIFADLTGVEDLQRALTVLMRTEAEIANSSFPRLALEMALVRLCHLPPARELAGLIAKLEELEHRLNAPGAMAASAPRASSPPPPPAPAGAYAERREPAPSKKPEAPRPTSDAGPRDWPGLVAHVKTARRLRIAMALEQASLLELTPTLMRLGLAKGSFALDSLQDVDTIADLRMLANEYFATQLEIRLVALDESETAVLAAPSIQQTRREQESALQRELSEEARSHPLVRSACELFKGEIVEVRPIGRNPEAADETVNGD